jgi:hypothetical protein
MCGLALEVSGQEHSQTAGGESENKLGFRVGGDDRVDEVEFFEEGVEETGQVHGVELAAVAGQLNFDGVLDDAVAGVDVVAAEAASTECD